MAGAAVEAVAAIPLQWHAAEALLEVDLRRADMPGVDILAMLAAGMAMLEEDMLAIEVATLGVPTLAIGVARDRMVLE